MKYEKVNHPSHYQGERVEAIDVIESYSLNFSLGNAIKYLLRAGKKPDSSYEEDLAKAVWYIQREIQRSKKDETQPRQEPQDVYLLQVREHAQAILPNEERLALRGQNNRNASIPF